jgi:hypothetical protein
MPSLIQLAIFHAVSFVFSETYLSAEARQTFEKEKAVGYHTNSHVSKILPLTTFKTIDLGGRKISGRLFSGFCAESSVFFDVFSAPEYVQQRRW